MVEGLLACRAPARWLAAAGVQPMLLLEAVGLVDLADCILFPGFEKQGLSARDPIPMADPGSLRARWWQQAAEVLTAAAFKGLLQLVTATSAASAINLTTTVPMTSMCNLMCSADRLSASSQQEPSSGRNALLFASLLLASRGVRSVLLEQLQACPVALEYKGRIDLSLLLHAHSAAASIARQQGRFSPDPQLVAALLAAAHRCCEAGRLQVSGRVGCFAAQR